MSRLVSGCIIVVGTLMLVLMALTAVVLLNLRPPSPPDVGAVARSKKVADADARATKGLDDQISALLSARPWLHPLTARSVDDHCFSREEGVFGGLQWTPVGCARRVEVFAAFDGDFAARNQDIDKSLHALGWFPGTYDIPNVMGNYYKTMKGTTTAPSAPPYGANDLPSATYYLRQQDPSQALNLNLTMAVGWAERTPAAAPEAVPPAPRSASQREYRPVDRNAVLTEGLHAHKYVITFSVTSDYFSAPNDLTTPTPSPTPTPYCACYSGNLCTCPGG